MKGKIVQTKITNQLRTPYSNLGIHEIEHNVYIHFIDDLFASFTTCSKKGTNRRTRKQGAELTERDRERQPRGVVVRELLWFSHVEVNKLFSALKQEGKNGTGRMARWRTWI
jgi:hypothetical protein